MPVLGRLEKGRVPVLIWAPINEVESSALDQLKNIASLPFVYSHVAAMPDVHLGKGATVGSVVATKGAVCPAAVGVDIGCGMAAVKLRGVTASHLGDSLGRLRGAIEGVIPVGFESNRQVGADARAWSGWKAFGDLHPKVQDLQSKAQSQLGSLGGGNHFIEVCLDTSDGVWLMLHSGSRNIGKELAEAHIRTAKGLMKEARANLKDPELAYFLDTQPQYHAYLRDLLWAQDYARANRDIMLGRLYAQVMRYLGRSEDEDIRETVVNCHHNFAQPETHFGEKVLVTRKGAVQARRGDMGIIPGSMGTRSYIVRGLGNAQSFQSCSHGAGRRMSRSEAKRRFDVGDLREQTAGVECRKDAGVVDEIPAAYKDIDTVMRHQNDLVEVVAQLKQVLCVKG